eukprot:SAG31_NODE_1370_length_8610_cov_2.897192_1_plen_112_part_00
MPADDIADDFYLARVALASTLVWLSFAVAFAFGLANALVLTAAMAMSTLMPMTATIATKQIVLVDFPLAVAPVASCSAQLPVSLPYSHDQSLMAATIVTEIVVAVVVSLAV